MGDTVFFVFFCCSQQCEQDCTHHRRSRQAVPLMLRLEAALCFASRQRLKGDGLTVERSEFVGDARSSPRGRAAHYPPLGTITPTMRGPWPPRVLAQSATGACSPLPPLSHPTPPLTHMHNGHSRARGPATMQFHCTKTHTSPYQGER